MTDRFSRADIDRAFKANCGYTGNYEIAGAARLIIKQLLADKDKLTMALRWYGDPHSYSESLGHKILKDGGEYAFTTLAEVGE